jgi:methyl-accepting chemotaxis protein
MQNRFSKKLGIFIVALLAISTIAAAIPFASATITSRPTIYIDDTTSDPLYVQAGTYVNISTAGMTITGAQVWLWLSTYGGSEIDQGAGDRVYAGPFYLGDVTNATASKVIPVSAGNVPAPFDAEGRAYSFVVGYGWINGTVPLLVQGSNVDYWIKIADQSPREIIVGSEVGVSNNRIRFTTGFGATPLAGAPDTLVTVSGYAIATGIVYNITQGAQLVDYFVSSTTNNASGWLWTGFSVPFNIMDLQGLTTPAPTMTSTVNITVTNHNTTLTAASWLFVQTFREVYLPTGTFRAYAGDYTGVTFNTGANYNVTLNWFPASGSASIYLNSTLVASAIALNGTGGNGYTTITIPSLLTGNYFFRVIDNHLVEYNFTIHVLMVPYIICTPDTGYVGDSFTVTGVNFLDYVGQYITLYFQNQYPSAYVRLWNETISSSGWVTGTLTVPQSWGGPRYVEARTSNGTVLITYDIYTVLAMINVIPDVVNNTCQTIQVEGTGFAVGYEGGPEDFFFYIDNSMYFGDDEDWASAINSTGYILTEFVAAGFRPGLHEVHVIGDYEGYMMWTVFAKDCFLVSTVDDPIVAYLEDINATVVAIDGNVVTLNTTVGELSVTIDELDATITALDGTIATLSTTVGDIQVDLTAIGATITTISGNVATIKTDVGTIKTSVTSLSSSISSISGGMATIQTSIGEVKTSLATLDTVIGSMYGDIVNLDTAIGSVETSLDALDATVTTMGDNLGDLATIQTSIGTIEGKIVDIESGLMTISTDLGTVKVDLAAAKTDISAVETDVNDNLPVDMLPVWIAVVLALIAAIGSIAGVFITQRKIA